MPNFYIADSEQELKEHNEQLAQIEQSEIQSECDHDWEFYGKFKVCTYPECQLEKALTEDE